MITATATDVRIAWSNEGRKRNSYDRPKHIINVNFLNGEKLGRQKLSLTMLDGRSFSDSLMNRLAATNNNHPNEIYK